MAWMLFAADEINWLQALVTIIGAFLIALPTIIGSIGSLIVSLRNQKELKQNTAITVASIDKTAAKVDSALEKSVAQTKIEAERAATAVAAKAIVVAEKVAVKTAEKTAQKTEEVMAELTTAINGRVDQMIEQAKESAFLHGREAAANEMMATQIKEILKDHMSEIQAQVHRHQERNDASMKQLREELAKLQAADAQQGETP